LNAENNYSGPQRPKLRCRKRLSFQALTHVIDKILPFSWMF